LPLIGGAEIAVKEITDRLGDLFDFDLITLRFSGNHKIKEAAGNVSVYRIGGAKWAYPFKTALLARKLHRQNSYQVVWSVMAAYAGFAALFFKLLHPKVPMLLTLQEGDSEGHILKRVGILYPFWRLIFKKADHIQAISSYLADFARRHGATCHIEIVPNGVNLDAYKTNRTYRSNKTYTVITTSRLVYKNGIDTLIRACAQLLTTNYQLLIIGDGPDRLKLEKLANDLGVSNKVKFIGHIDPALIPEYLAKADIFVRPSRSEGLGNSFLEAMAAGLPVIGTAVGGIPDFLVDNVNGLFSKVDDPKDLAEKITRIANNPELSRRLSENGQKLVKEKYSWNPISYKMNKIFGLLTTYHSLLTKKLLLATGIYPPEIGGPATYAALLEQELPQR
ncbi:MAG: glycosyltransferase family 4 protein, partial [Patescibacteria group bacterium]